MHRCRKDTFFFGQEFPSGACRGLDPWGDSSYHQRPPGARVTGARGVEGEVSVNRQLLLPC
jgi:hypothetical protein